MYPAERSFNYDLLKEFNARITSCINLFTKAKGRAFSKYNTHFFLDIIFLPDMKFAKYNSTKSK